MVRNSASGRYSARVGVGSSVALPQEPAERRTQLTTNGNGNGPRRRGRGVRALIPDPPPNLADGSHPGVRPNPDFELFVAAVDAGNVLRAQLEHATTLLRQLEGVLTRTGGYMTPEDQVALRSARAFLVDSVK